MLLIVTNQHDATADFLEEKVKATNLPYARFNTEEFPLQVCCTCRDPNDKAIGTLEFPDGKKCNLEDIGSIWWRRPYLIESTALEGIEDEEARRFAKLQIREVLEHVWGFLADRCRWVNNPDDNRRAESRILQMKIAKEIGFAVPATIITNVPRHIVRFFSENSGTGVVHKVMRRTAFFQEGKMRGFYTQPLTETDVQHANDVVLAPVYLQSLIEKKSELRVTVIGNRVFTARIKSCETPNEKLDWRRIPPEKQAWEAASLGKTFERSCTELIQALNLLFGTIDFAVTPQDELVFFEVNPNGQWAWLEMQLGLPMRDAFLELFF